jgi:pimeloyl-ACP methyl ester carboxylesterase
MMALRFAKIQIQIEKNAVIFVHGFSGDAYKTFGMMPAFVAGDLELTDWDIYSFGYKTGLAPSLTGVWSSDPDLTVLSKLLTQRINEEYSSYKNLSLIAHSMGGLIVQRTLLDIQNIDLVKHVLLFGTPSKGLSKAKKGGWLCNTQINCMRPDSEFILNLRKDWTSQYKDPPFEFEAIAGTEDQFVPRTSSLEPFDEKYHYYVNGNHLEIVKPSRLSTDSIARVLHRLKGSGPHTAVNQFQIPHEYDLEPKQIVERTMTLELSGEPLKAIELLTQNIHKNYYVAGALAGRYKRMWLAQLDEPTGQKYGMQAKGIYEEAFSKAVFENKFNQACYNGINAAFMYLGLDGNKSRAHAIAEQINQDLLPNMQKDPKWYKATAAETQLHLRTCSISRLTT